MIPQANPGLELPDPRSIAQEVSLLDTWVEGHIEDLFQFGVALLIVILVLYAGKRYLDRAQAQQQFSRQLLQLGLTFVALIAVVLNLPVKDGLITAMLSLIGIVLSAVLALSSTTLMGNALAGIMLRGLRNFRTGDFVRCGDHFGRVTERGLVHTEIQTEDSDLTTLPNLYLVSNPLTTVRSSGTIVSATTSLGYDVSRHAIEKALVRAAERAELKAPFVQVLDLGDYSVTYRIAGLLEEVKQILSVRSRLRQCMMDELHADGIEIVSPTFMNQRPIHKDFIPEETTAPRQRVESSMPEELVFDKAEAAETVEVLKQELAALDKEIEDYAKQVKAASGEEQAALQKRLDGKLARRENMGHVIEAYEARQKEH